MALEKIDPFNFNKFKDMTKGSVEKIVSYFEESEYGSWEATLKNYSWQGQKFSDGETIRKDFNKKIRSPNENISYVMAEILEWGGMKAFDKGVELKVVESLKILDNENVVDLSKIYANRIASVSKIYEMRDPAKWIIYDSYCSRGLQWIVKQFWEKIKCKRNFCILNFPQPPGKSEKNKPIEGFPRKTSENQFRFAFIYASWLCRLIAQELNLKNKSDFKWESYHVEMALFTLGHTVDM